MKKLWAIILASTTIAVSTAVFSVPSMREINNVITQENWQKAHNQLVEVLRAHPNSTHAHYLYGQVLAKEGRPQDALSELQKAQNLDPELRFASSVVQFNIIKARVRKQIKAMIARSEVSQSIVEPHYNLSIGVWISCVVIMLALIALLVRRAVLYTRFRDDSHTQEQRRAQLKRATDLLNATRSLKLDIRLSAVPGHESRLDEIDTIETQLCKLTDQLANNDSPIPDYTLQELERRLDSLQAHAERRNPPNQITGNSDASNVKQNTSVYTQETEWFGRIRGGVAPSYSATLQPGCAGLAIGGLLTGVLLDQTLSSGSRERMIEEESNAIFDEGRQYVDINTQIDPECDISLVNEDSSWT
ncbi:tetratricopeptide repeat protein [Candidatus Vallotia cooleyia]|uniref:tetratricopeptide repeat protein n=1 Tax=Candidatus Vallotiella adelgis TaxID=1177211 RepID=UPI001D0026D2|nr:tetratricopeptide repeat protein [Candidatus Vallotia cooleyia]UDG82289.1 hypothetical protein GJV44_00548 [Candidatus Vallotia cooleyia]